MKGDAWARAETLFARVSECSDTRREELLRAAARDDPEVCAEVRSLLARHESGEHWIDRPALAEGAFEDPQGLLEGGDLPLPARRRLGPFELRRALGAGGMGTVYLAQRIDGEVHQTVAVKLIKRGMDSDEILRRFQHERETLARLEHPGIARFIDAGASDDGRPWLALEYVAGVPLMRYCDERALSIEERLELVLRVCDAVEHAHRSLVIHRDLKPGNILVQEDGSPKLLDFGIAKVLTPGEQHASLTTTLESPRFLSPEYASPELLRGEPVGVATDVYSLGVLLFRLLSGESPFRLDGLSAAEIERFVCETEAPRLGLVRGLARDARRRFAGDLENVVAKALRKEPDERYASVRELAEDLERHLGHRPVLATRPTWTYRVRKFVRRHRAASVAALFVVSSLAAGTGAVLAQSRRAERAARDYRTAVVDLADLVVSLDPTSHEELSARAIRAGANRLAALLSRPSIELPIETRDTVERSLARVYAGLGLTRDARPWARAVLERQRAQLDPHDVRWARELVEFGPVAGTSGEERRALAREAVAILSRDSAPRRERVDALLWASSSEVDRGQVLAMARAATDACAALDPVPPILLVRCLDRLGAAYWNEREYAAAEEALRKAWELVDSAVLEDGLPLARVLMHLGTLMQDRARYKDGLACVDRALEIYERLLPDDHPEAAVQASMVALLLKDMGRFDDAAELALDALERLEAYDPAHPHMDDALLAVAKIRCDRGAPGDLERAEAACLRALEQLGRQQSFALVRIYAVAETLLGRIRLGLGRPADAAEALERAVAHQAAIQQDDWEAAKTRSLLGSAWTGLRRFDEAEALLLASLPRIREDRGPTHHRTTQALLRVIEHYEARGMGESAAQYRAQLSEEALASPLLGASQRR